MARLTHTFSGQKLEPIRNPEEAKQIAIKLPASVSYPMGQVLGQRTADALIGRYVAYATGASDGSEVAKKILIYQTTTDADGNHFSGSSAGSQHGESSISCVAFESGEFLTSELTGLDAAAVTDLGRLVSGTVANGIIRIG